MKERGQIHDPATLTSGNEPPILTG